MNLTKAIRTELAEKLMIKAIEKHADPMGAEAERLNNALETAHRARLAAAMPEVPPSRYAALIQAGILAYTASGAETIYYPVRREDGSLTTRSESPGQAVIGKVSEEVRDLLRGTALKGSKWAKFFHYFSVGCYSHSMEARLEMEPRLSCSLPDFKGRHYVRLDAQEPENIAGWSEESLDYMQAVEPIFEQAKKLARAAAEVFRQGLEYREEVMDLLQACKTDKQLRELFPEAASLLPAPVVKQRALVPTELAAKVRKQLKEGVPV
jgi:hypothetical protein